MYWTSDDYSEESTDVEAWIDDEFEYDGGSIHYTNGDNDIRTFLDKSDSEYVQVSRLFLKTGSTKKFSVSLKHIEKVCNQELLEKFERKKLEYKQKYGHFRIVKVFHGSKSINIPSILKNNLQVQRHGQNRGHRFGAGVSFSAFANYASHYCDSHYSKSDSYDQMLLCYVIISNITEVPELKRKGQVLKKPPFIEGKQSLRYDTTAKNKHSMDVIVKFEDHTFYPAYVIHFVKSLKSNLLPSDDKSVPRSQESIAPKMVPKPTLYVPPNHQESIVRKQATISTPNVVPRHQESVVPKQISKPTPPVVPSRQKIVAPTPVFKPVNPRRQENVVPKQIPKPTTYMVPSRQEIVAPISFKPVNPRRQENVVPGHIFRPTSRVVPRPNLFNQEERTIQWLMQSPSLVTPVVAPPETQTKQSGFAHSVLSFFRKLCCCG
ncbi:uncharacterized protein LOC117639798 [Thrips palmi]|uniref:Poly [ADP-ribose] polymerase n=1 Tax=Thrips palmi TaxID=161013 RepID=A0A6P8Y6I0_THRPL|nr:uncharacterized protein LOC117639798 [Thrips palmi]